MGMIATAMFMVVAPKPPQCTAAKDLQLSTQWFWLGDSSAGSQDTWIEYDSKTSELLENGHKAGLARVEVDSERFVDIKNLLQRRYDDPNKRRTVKRVPIKRARDTNQSPSKRHRALSSTRVVRHLVCGAI